MPYEWRRNHAKVSQTTEQQIKRKPQPSAKEKQEENKTDLNRKEESSIYQKYLQEKSQKVMKSKQRTTAEISSYFNIVTHTAPKLKN